MALDRHGRASVSYYDLTNDVLKYATRADNAWVTEVIDRAGNVGGETALALDAAGRPHISYHDIMGNALKYCALDRHAVGNRDGGWRYRAGGGS